MNLQRALTAALVLLPAPAWSQASAVLDEATFIVTRQGAPIGRESFKIIRAPGPGGQVYRASASSAMEEVRNLTTLATDSAGSPVSYESQVSLRGDVLERIQGRGRRDRFSVLLQTKRGEAVQEYIVRPGTIVLEEDQFHQYWFAVRAGSQGQLTAIEPRTGEQGDLRLEELGNELITVGRQRIAGRHVALTDPGGERREVWVDRAGRLLRVSVPSRGLLATRDDPPRATP